MEERLYREIPSHSYFHLFCRLRLILKARAGGEFAMEERTSNSPPAFLCALRAILKARPRGRFIGSALQAWWLA